MSKLDLWIIRISAAIIVTLLILGMLWVLIGTDNTREILFEWNHTIPPVSVPIYRE